MRRAPRGARLVAEPLSHPLSHLSTFVNFCLSGRAGGVRQRRPRALPSGGPLAGERPAAAPLVKSASQIRSDRTGQTRSTVKRVCGAFERGRVSLGWVGGVQEEGFEFLRNPVKLQDCITSLMDEGSLSPPPPPSRTKWTRRVPHPVLIGHAAALSQVQDTHRR